MLQENKSGGVASYNKCRSVCYISSQYFCVLIKYLENRSQYIEDKLMLKANDNIDNADNSGYFKIHIKLLDCELPQY